MNVRYLLVVGLSMACGSNHLPTATLTFGQTQITVEIADDSAERARGLMHRDSLGPDQGMIFVYPIAQPRHFWMKDTRIPLSIAFIDEHGVIVKIEDMAPLSTKQTASLYPAKYALEVNQGWFTQHHVEVASTVGGLSEIPEAKRDQ